MSDFVTSQAGSHKSHGVDVMMNEDGTMQVAGEDGSDEDEDE